MPIVDEKTYQKAQELAQLTVRECPNKGEVYLFSGLMRCADCARGMDRTTVRKDKTGKVYASYRCSTYFRNSKEACTGHTIPERVIYDVVLNAIQMQIRAFCDVEAVLKQVDGAKRRKTELEMLDKQYYSVKAEIDSLERIKLGLYTDFKKNIITEDEYIALKTGYAEQIGNLSEALATLTQERDGLANQEDKQNEWLERFRKYRNVDSLNRTLVTELIDRIYIHEDKRITINFKFKDEFESILSEIENLSEMAG